jgi:hypothetical protein
MAIKKMTDLTSDEIKKPSTTKTYVVEWIVTIAGTTLGGAMRVRSKDSKVKIHRRSKLAVFNTLGVIGVSNIDTETFRATVTDA